MIENLKKRCAQCYTALTWETVFKLIGVFLDFAEKFVFFILLVPGLHIFAFHDVLFPGIERWNEMPAGPYLYTGIFFLLIWTWFVAFVHKKRQTKHRWKIISIYLFSIVCIVIEREILLALYETNPGHGSW